MITIYVSEGCGKCEALKRRLEKNGFDFSVSKDIGFLVEKGYQNAPILQIDNAFYDLKASMRLLKDFESGKGLLMELTKEK